MKLKALAFAAAAIGLSLPGFSQTFTANLTGVISDPAGSAQMALRLEF